jgi:hypothetical protein
MTHCPVTADLNRHLDQHDADEALGKAVDKKLETMMTERNTVAAIVDDVLQDAPYWDHAENGSTRLADWIAEIIVAGTGTDVGEQKLLALFEQIEGHVKVRMRLDAETEVAHQAERDAQEAAEMRGW